MPVQSTRETIQIPDVGIYEFTLGQLHPADEDKVAIIDIADRTEPSYQQLRRHLESDAVGIYDLPFGRLGQADGDKVAIVDIAECTETSYQQLRSYIERVAGGLSHLGIRSGAVVALHCPISLAFVVYAHAVWRLGATLTP